MVPVASQPVAEVFLRLGRRIALAALACLLLLGTGVVVASQGFAQRLTNLLMGYQLQGIGAELLARLRTDRQVDLEHLGHLLDTLPAEGEALWHLAGDTWLRRLKDPGSAWQTNPEKREVVIESLRLDTPDQRRDLSASLGRLHELMWASQVAHPGLLEAQLLLFCKGNSVALVTGQSQPGFPGMSRSPVLASIGQSASFLPRPVYQALWPDWPNLRGDAYQSAGQLQLPVRGEGKTLGVLRLHLSPREAAQVAQQQARWLTIGMGLSLTLAALATVALAVHVRRLAEGQVGQPLSQLSTLLSQVDDDQDGRIGLVDAQQSIPRLEEFDRQVRAVREIQAITSAARQHLELLAQTLKENDQIQAELRLALGRLEEASQGLVQASKGWVLAELGAWVAHDLNNKLQGAYSISSNWLEREQPCPLKHLKFLHASLEKAIEQIDQFRHLAHPQSLARVDRVDAQELLEDLRLLVSQRLQQAQVELQLEVQEGLYYQRVWPGKLQDMLMNLVFNGCDAKATLLRIVARGPHLEVCDNGHGIAEADQEQLWNRPFFTTKGKAGSGLGLRIVASVVAELGGQVSCRSQPGQGSTFSITLGSDHVGLGE